MKALIAKDSWDVKARKRWGQIRHWLDTASTTGILFVALNLLCRFDIICLNIDEESWGVFLINTDSLVNMVINSVLGIISVVTKWWVHISSLIAAKQ